MTAQELVESILIGTGALVWLFVIAPLMAILLSVAFPFKGRKK